MGIKAVESCRELRKEEENARREGRKMNDTGGRSRIKNRVLCCIAVSLPVVHPGETADATRCEDALLYCSIRTIKYITYGFTAALLRREHRPPILIAP